MTKLQKFLQVASATATVLALSPLSVLAVASDEINITTNVDGNISGLKPSVLVSGAINTILGVSGIIAFFFLLIGGIQWIIAGGDKENTEKARKKITAALVGLAIVFSAYALLYIVSALFNINLLNFTLKPLKDIKSGF